MANPGEIMGNSVEIPGFAGTCGRSLFLQDDVAEEGSEVVCKSFYVGSVVDEHEIVVAGFDVIVGGVAERLVAVTGGFALDEQRKHSAQGTDAAFEFCDLRGFPDMRKHDFGVVAGGKKFIETVNEIGVAEIVVVCEDLLEIGEHFAGGRVLFAVPACQSCDVLDGRDAGNVHYAIVLGGDVAQRILAAAAAAVDDDDCLVHLKKLLR